MAIPAGAICSIRIKTPHSTLVNVDNVDEVTARFIVEDVKAQHSDDATLQEMIANCVRSFGLCSRSRDGYEVHISARAPLEQTDERVFCKRRYDNMGFFKPREMSAEEYDRRLDEQAEREEKVDRWDKVGNDRCCSYCGSIHPDDLIALIHEQGLSVIDPSDKGYKWYLNRPGIPNAGFGAIKYYRQHDTPEFLAALRELVNPGQGKTEAA